MSTIDDDRTSPQLLDGIGQNLILKRKGSIVVFDQDSNNYGIHDTGSRNKATIEGEIRSFNDIGNGIGILSSGEKFKVTVEKTGVVEGNYGVFFNGATSTIINSGRISGTTDSGLAANGFVDIENNKSITGENGLYLFGGADVTNRGTITGSNIGISTNNTIDYDIQNFGTIKGLGGTAIKADYGDIHIINAGKIVGDIKLGDGDDRIEIRGGSILGGIFSGDGDDTLITNSSKYKLIEASNDGFDTVKSSVSYKLNEHVDTLILTGKKNINGTGDGTNLADSNYFYGNKGNNVLKGVGLGDNEFYGGKGKDTYIGVDGQYDIYGLRHGDGKETVKTFVKGEDLINLYHFKGFDYETPFEDIQAHFKQKGDDTWINMGKGDILILEDTTKNSLEYEDFLFNF